MLFLIKDNFGKNVFRTEYASCIPFEDLNSMESAGLSFYVDGKKVSKSFLRNNFDNEADEVETDSTIENVSTPSEVVTDKFDIRHKVVESKTPDTVDPGFPITNRTIICVNTGKYYKNQKEAADEYKFDPANISYCVTTGKSYKGYFFKRVVDAK